MACTSWTKYKVAPIPMCVCYVVCVLCGLRFVYLLGCVIWCVVCLMCNICCVMGVVYALCI